jgi:hypothetical protein
LQNNRRFPLPDSRNQIAADYKGTVFFRMENYFPQYFEQKLISASNSFYSLILVIACQREEVAV